MNGAKGIGEIPVEPFQRRFEELKSQGVLAADIARKLGWVTPQGTADGPRVTRRLGLRPHRNGKGKLTQTQQLSYGMACKLADAMGLDPWEIGL